MPHGIPRQGRCGPPDAYAAHVSELPGVRFLCRSAVRRGYEHALRQFLPSSPFFWPPASRRAVNKKLMPSPGFLHYPQARPSWWQYLGVAHRFFADVTVLSDLRGEGDRSLVDDFSTISSARGRRPRRAAIPRAPSAKTECADIHSAFAGFLAQHRPRALRLADDRRHDAGDRAGRSMIWTRISS